VQAVQGVVGKADVLARARLAGNEVVVGVVAEGFAACEAGAVGVGRRLQPVEGVVDRTIAYPRQPARFAEVLRPDRPKVFLDMGHRNTTTRSAIEAVHIARQQGKKVSYLVVYSLWPVPENAITRALNGIERVVVPELNLGQYCLELKRLANSASSSPRPDVIGVHRVDGELISPQQILEAIR